MPRPPLPPFTVETATHKVRVAEDAWNTRDPERVALAYQRQPVAQPSRIFSRAVSDHPISAAQMGQGARLPADQGALAVTGNRIAVRFQYEWHDDSGNWYRAHGNEQWEFDADGLMRRREASINDVPIREADRLFCWPLGPRPADHPGLDERGL